MSYAMGSVMYAAAGLGRSGLGRGLGFDRAATDAPAGAFITGVSHIAGPTGWNAAGAPGVFKQAFEAQGFHAVTSDWQAGGRIWIRYSVGTLAEAADTTARRARARRAIDAAARLLGVSVTLDDGTVVDGRTAGTSSVEMVLPETTITVTREVSTVIVNTLTLQQTLYAKGFNPGTQDGLWGRNTSGH